MVRGLERRGELLCPDLVGRRDELTVLRAVAEAARARDGAAVVVSGEAGIGKSALVRAALPADRTATGGAAPSGVVALTGLVEWVAALASAGADLTPARLGVHRTVLAAIAP